MSSKDTVHDLSQLLLEKPESCYRTCTSAWHNKKRLDDFCELGAVDGLKQGDIVELVEGGGDGLFQRAAPLPPHSEEILSRASSSA